MNFIFGIIILALLIIAVRVILATLWQSLACLKALKRRLSLQLAQRAEKLKPSVVYPCLPTEPDWELMATNVRSEIHRRNASISAVERLDAQLQARLKTIELIKVDIQIAKLEQELQKVKPATVEMPEADAVKAKRPKKSKVQGNEDNPYPAAQQVSQLRAALKGSKGGMTPVSEPARH